MVDYINFFFFKQKTAYEMRISDWSSDVCSSDLARPEPDRGDRGAMDRGGHLCPRRISRRDIEALPGSPRHPEEPHLRGRPCADQLRTAAQRSGVRLLRPPQATQPRLRLIRIQPDRPPPRRPRQEDHPNRQNGVEEKKE